MRSASFKSISALLLAAGTATACGDDDAPTEGPHDPGPRGGWAGAYAGNGAAGGASNAGRGGAGAPASGGTASGSGGRGQGAAGRHAGGMPSGGTAGNAAGDAGETGRGGRLGHAGNSSSGTAGAVATGGRGEAGTSTTGASGESGEAGSDHGGAAGAPDGEERQFAYVSRLLGGVQALAIDPESGELREIEGSPADTGRFLYTVVAEPDRRFLFTAEPNEGHIDSYRVAADGTLPEAPNSTHVVDAQPITLALDRSGNVLYAGTLEDQSIHALRIDRDTGELQAAGEPLVLTTPPAYLATEPTGRFLYQTQEFVPGIRGYRIGPTGALTELEDSPFGETLVRCGALAFTPDGHFLFTSGQSLSAFAIDPDSGALDVVDGSPFSNDVSSDFFAGNLAVDPQGAYLYVTSFSATQHVSGFAILPNGTLEQVPDSPARTSSPYSLAVEPTGRFLYVGNDTGDMSVFAIDRSNGSFDELETSPFPFGGLQPQFAFVAGR